MNKLLPHIKGSFHIDIANFPGTNAGDLIQSLEFFLKSQYPSGYKIEGLQLSFFNRIIRLRVNRGRNYLKAFNQGSITVKPENEKLFIEYQGSLYRGILVSAIQALIAFALFTYVSPSGWWAGVVVFVIGYLLTVSLSHVVFPMWLAKHIHTFLSEQADDSEQ